MIISVNRATGLAALFGASGVLLGAFGAHALKPQLADYGTAPLWQTAVFYQLVHALALFVAGGWRSLQGKPLRFLDAVTGCWTLGIAGFSGSLYLLALRGPRWLGPVTPFGGLAFLAGWLLVLAGVWRKSSD
ncbi:MAG: DUF423 domain-containing protein [Opitutaceae bacterium]|nr:DUF423 domain-containing protein [Opitutaceae bacterium]